MTDDIQPTIMKAERNFRDEGTVYEIWIGALTRQGAERRSINYAARQSRTRDVAIIDMQQTDVDFRNSLIEIPVLPAMDIFRIELIANT